MPDEFEEKPGREKKHSNFTLCSVCNIQLNSAAQAQIHYNGKSHQKRLKQLTNGTLKNGNGKIQQSMRLVLYHQFKVCVRICDYRLRDQSLI
ncbi:Zinc finger protein 385B [Lemmus lemmus]